MYRRIRIRIGAHFLSETLQNRRQQIYVFKMMGNKFNLEFYIQQYDILIIKGKTNNFTDLKMLESSSPVDLYYKTY